MAGGKEKVPKQYMEIVEGCLRNFVEKVYNTLKEHGYNLDIIPIIFVGGGATVMKMYGNSMGANIWHIEDVRANAKGYECLGRTYLAENRKAMEAEVG